MPETVARPDTTTQVRDEAGAARTGRRAPVWLKGLLPIALLALLIAALFAWGPGRAIRSSFPPVEEITITRVTFPEPGELRMRVVNGGPEPVTVAQVLVDDALWTHTVNGDRRINRLDSREIVVPYPWVEGEPHTVRIVTSTGLTFDHTVDVATRTPRPDAYYLGTFALLGTYVGVIPVFLGLLWLPFLRSIHPKWIDFFLSFTVGLLVFLGLDALAESLELAELVPGAFQGTGLVVIGLLGTPLLIQAATRLGGRDDRSNPATVALLIAIAIGLHNLGEGLAIGAAYAAGAVALGTFLVLGFLIHNTTEGLGIVAPLSRERPSLARLIALGAIAGVPTILGTWIGGFTYSPVLTTLFLAVGAGAVAQVVVAIGRLIARQGGAYTSLNGLGFIAGLLVMYATGLLVTA